MTNEARRAAIAAAFEESSEDDQQQQPPAPVEINQESDQADEQEGFEGQEQPEQVAPRPTDEKSAGVRPQPSDVAELEKAPQSWKPAEPEMETAAVGSTEEKEAPQRITDQRVIVDYVFWEDFLWSPCRVWTERRWVARRVYMSRDELVKRFGEKGKLVSLDAQTNTSQKYDANQQTPKENTVKKAAVWEIWERSTRKVVWFSESASDILEVSQDPLGLVGFEPCPMPMLANITTSNTVPRPDYYMIQDQYQELDTINNRISMLVQACKVAGVYDKSAIGVQRLMQEGADNLLIPVDNWAMFAEKNGLKGQIDWLPLESVLTALTQLNNARDVIKAQIYELTGISDIVRGASKASETLGAQQIKAQFAGVRIEKLQNQVARFAADILRIKAEIQIKHFTPELLVKKSNILTTGNDEWIGPALELMQSDEGFEWRIQVTADSIAQADYQIEREERTEFLTSVTGYLQTAGEMAKTTPEAAPLLLGMLKWAVASYRGAAEIEGQLDKALDAMEKSNQQGAEAPPDPAAQAAQAEAQAAQQKAQLDAQKAQLDIQAKQQDLGIKQQLGQQQLQLEQQLAQIRLEEAKTELQIKQLELQLKQEELQLKQEELAMKAQAGSQQLSLDMQRQDMERQRMIEEAAENEEPGDA